jgi:Cytochrome b(C-terminal)/b6/petD
MHGSDALTGTIQNGLGIYYLLVMALNLGFAAYYLSGGRNKAQGLLWTVVSGIFLLHALAYFAHLGWVLPRGFKDSVTNLMGAMGGQLGPILYTLGSVVGFILFLRYRRFITQPLVAWTIFDLFLLASGWSITDSNFRLIVTKEDNVPIVMLIFTVGFFTWLAFRKGVINDERIADGQPPVEKTEDEKVLVWPDLVYTEMIAMIVMTLILVVWAVFLKAPLEQPASSAKAPNPSKAPWYFLGLQEMLVYYDPWMAGVVLPTMIIVGLVALPYIDFNQKGNGYFTFAQRKFAVSVFLLGFVVMWCTLIVLGTFLRGPNWNFFSPFEYWDPHKVLPLNNVNLSDYFWLPLGVVFPEGQGIGGILLRESPGIILVLAYLFLLPPLLAKTVMRSFFVRMGFIRFFLLVNLIQFMAALPIKMILRWTINLKYIVYIPEYFFNI